MTDDGEIRDEIKPPNNHYIFAKLAEKFAPEAVKSRNQGGRELKYVTARTVMNRLDDVIGPWNWWDHYVETRAGVKCILTIRLPDGTEITKEDVGGESKMQDPSDTEKSAYSDAFKRAAVKFGIGRYLYGDRVPVFVRELLAAEAVQARAGAAQGEYAHAG